MSGALVLVVSDNSLIVRICNEVFSLLGYTVDSVSGVSRAVSRLGFEARLERRRLVLLVLDLCSVDGDRSSVMGRIRELDPLLSVVAIADCDASLGDLDLVSNLGVLRVISKPITRDRLLLVARDVFAYRTGEQQQMRPKCQSAILEVSQALETSEDVESLVRELLRVVIRQFEADWAAMLLWDEVRRDWKVAGVLGGDLIGDYDTRAWRQLLKKDDISDSVLLSPHDAVVAVRSLQNRIGLLRLSRSTQAFRSVDQELLKILATQVGGALESLQLRQAVVQVKREWVEAVNAIAEGILVHDTELRIIHVNRALAEWLGVAPEDLVGHTFHSTAYGESDGSKLQSLYDIVIAIAWDRANTVEIEEPALGGTFLISSYPKVDGQGYVTGAVHIIRDITALRRAEQQILQSEKLSVLGRLTAHLAHEINNPLQALRSGLGLLLNNNPDQQKQRQYLDVANREVERLIGLTDGVLNFYRPSDSRHELVDICDEIDEVFTLVSKKAQHSGVALECNLDRHMPAVEAVPDQLRQVFLNIVLNALEAMPHGGRLTVLSGLETHRREVWVSFTDTGEGIPAEAIPRLFTSLYSSKPQGTGLGLAISHGIIERHGGRTEVTSEVGHGSTFTVFLPVADLDSS